MRSGAVPGANLRGSDETDIVSGPDARAVPEREAEVGDNVGGKRAQLALMPNAERIRAIESGRAGLLDRARELVVDGAESEQMAWAVVNAIGELQKRITADFGPARKATHGAWKAVVAQEKGHLETLEEPDRIVRAKLSAWETEKRRRQAEAERKAREDAERATAELRRQARERAQKEAEDRRLREAVVAEDAGDTAKAEELLEAPVEAEPIVEATASVPVMRAEKVAGAGAMVEVWHFEIVDAEAIPREYLTVNESRIGKVVQALKGGTEIAGVRVYKTLEARRVGRR